MASCTVPGSGLARPLFFDSLNERRLMSCAEALMAIIQPLHRFLMGSTSKTSNKTTRWRALMAIQYTATPQTRRFIPALSRYASQQNHGMSCTPRDLQERNLQIESALAYCCMCLYGYLTWCLCVHASAPTTAPRRCRPGVVTEGPAVALIGLACGAGPCSIDYKVRPAYKSHKHLRAHQGQEGPRPRVGTARS